MSAADDNEHRRTSALACWRYAHDHMRAARTLCCRHQLRNAEAQAHYHLIAQAFEFALMAYLRAAGVPSSTLRTEYGHDLARLFEAALQHGLTGVPEGVVAPLMFFAGHHREREFRHVLDDPDGFPDLDDAWQALSWILDAIAPFVARDYTTRFAQANSPSTESFVLRLRADLAATAQENLPLA